MAIPAIVWSVVGLLIKMFTPTVQTYFQDAMKGVYKKALESESEYDDIQAKIMVSILGIDVSGVTITPTTTTKNIPPEIAEGLVGSFTSIATGRPFEDSILDPRATL